MNSMQDYLTPVDELCTGCEVIGKPMVKRTQSGEHKSRGELYAYMVPVQVTMSLTEREVDGVKHVRAIMKKVSVTLWADAEPSSVKVGDFVAFKQLAVGSYKDNVYFQAFGLEVNNEFKLEDFNA